MSYRVKVYDDESVDGFLERRFGQTVARVLGSAMVHGIWAADSRELSVRASFPTLWEVEERGWGGVIRGILRGLPKMVAEGERYEVGELLHHLKEVSVFSFRDGMETLPKRLLDRLRESPNVQVLLGTPVKSLLAGGSGIGVSVNSSIMFHTLKPPLLPGPARKRHNPPSESGSLDYPTSKASRPHPISCSSPTSQAQPLHKRNSCKLHLQLPTLSIAPSRVRLPCPAPSKRLHARSVSDDGHPGDRVRFVFPRFARLDARKGVHKADYDVRWAVGSGFRSLCGGAARSVVRALTQTKDRSRRGARASEYGVYPHAAGGPFGSDEGPERCAKG